MPIKPELRRWYPWDWSELSRSIRFRRAGGRCEGCGRQHGSEVPTFPGGAWFDGDLGIWRDDRGRRTALPRQPQVARTTRVVLATAHLNHDPADNRPRNLRALCGRCHLAHDRDEHRRRRWITYRARRAIGDLFLGQYRT